MPKDLSKDWQPLFDSESNREIIESIQVTLARSTATIYPPANDVWNAYKSTPLDKVKAVILGQDPYHGPGQAHGLSFSVSPGIKFPPSLRNIFKELKRDLDVELPLFGDLSRWANQGVFLLNSFLTVEANKAGSHRRIGWEQFTDSTIQYVSENTKHTVFMLWGNHAQSKRDLIDKTEHLILEAPHPSPLSAHRGFLGCDHFSEANKWLESKTRNTIDWSL